MAQYIIDAENDKNYYSEVRDLLGITSDDISDDVLKSDIFLGAAERMIIKVYAPNWQDIVSGSDQIAADALRSSIVIRVALQILNMPASQNFMFDSVQLIDMIFKSKGMSIDDLKKLLNGLFFDQLSLVGVEHSSEWPVRTLVGKSDSANVFDYYVDTNGDLQEG